MVKVPTLAEDGQNWKIYCGKLLEHAATKGWLDVLAGAWDDGMNDWEGCNALLHELLHDTIPISIYIRLRRNTAHQVFKNLAKHFCNRKPIVDPCAKKLATCTNEDKRDPSAESPMSENAATGAEREDPPMKALNRGTKDVDNGNVGCTEDPRMSLEASSKGNSTESAGTLVLLESVLHEMQNELQNSLPLTPRLPIDGEPNMCKQEVVDSVVTAERANGTVKMAEPTKTDADIDGKAALGRELAERVHRVDKGDEECDNELRPQQTTFYYEENHQRNESTNTNVHNAYRLLLVGEWDVYVCGEMANLNGDMDASNTAVERVYGPSELKETEDAMENESRGHKGSTSERENIDGAVGCCQQLCMADGGGNRGVEPTGMPNESESPSAT